MGLAASQGRLLSLTARNNDLVYEGHQISQQRLFLAEETSLAAKEYTEAMNNKIMQANVNGEKQLLTFDLLTSQDPFSGLFMRLVDAYGNVVVPGESLEVQQTLTDEETQETSTSTIGRFKSSADFIKNFMSDLSDDKKAELSTYSLANIYDYYNNNYESKDESITLIHKSKDNSNLIKEGETPLVDIYVNDPKYLQEMLIKGEYIIQQAQSDGTYGDLVWQGSAIISEVYDTSDDAAAEAEYETATLEIQKQDKILEMRLTQIETEQKAVSTELKSIKSVIKDNVENTYKTFA